MTAAATQMLKVVEVAGLVRQLERSDLMPFF
jgi:hypothetical protein